MFKNVDSTKRKSCPVQQYILLSCLNPYSMIYLLGASKTNVTVSAVSSALIVMTSSFPAHFKIFDML